MEEKVNKEDGHATGLEKHIEELENRLVEKDKVLAQVDRRVAEGEVVRARLDTEIAALKEKGCIASGSLETLKSSLAESVKSYRELVSKANPEVPVEMVSGDTVAAINESLEKAKGLVNRVKQNIEASIATKRIPAGAPARTSMGVPSLTPHEKITRSIK